MVVFAPPLSGVDIPNESGIIPDTVLIRKKGGIAMPTYDFKCEKCNKKFTLIQSISEYNKKNFRCPKCKSTKVKQQITSFQVTTTKKS